MINIVIKSENFKLVMLDRNIVEEISSFVAYQSNTGSFLPSIIRPVELWINRLNKGELWGKDNGYLAILDNKNALIGLVWHFSHGIEFSLELGINIFKPSERGKGIGSKVINAYTEYLFNTYFINRLQYNMAENNLPSERVAKKCGFQYEGMMRKAIFIRGKWHNLKLYSKLRGE